MVVVQEKLLRKSQDHLFKLSFKDIIRNILLFTKSRRRCPAQVCSNKTRKCYFNILQFELRQIGTVETC